MIHKCFNFLLLFKIGKISLRSFRERTELPPTKFLFSFVILNLHKPFHYSMCGSIKCPFLYPRVRGQAMSQMGFTLNTEAGKLSLKEDSLPWLKNDEGPQDVLFTLNV